MYFKYTILFAPVRLSSEPTSALPHNEGIVPNSAVVQLIEGRLSALANNIATNDHVALVHPDSSDRRETEDIIADVLAS